MFAQIVRPYVFILGPTRDTEPILGAGHFGEWCIILEKMSLLGHDTCDYLETKGGEAVGG